MLYCYLMDINTSYCLKCKSKKDMINGTVKTNVKGNKYISGNCSTCGCKMNKFLK